MQVNRNVSFVVVVVVVVVVEQTTMGTRTL